MAEFKHSYENENEVVITDEVFHDWCAHCNGNKAAMYSGVPSQIEKPFYHLNKTTGTKTQITKYEFVYHPNKLDVTADEIINGKDVVEVAEPNKTATARYFAKDGHVITAHKRIG